MYSHYPRRDQLRLRFVHAAVWALVASAGVSIAIDPGWATAASAPWALIAGGILLAAASVIAGTAVALNLYRVEWVAATFALVGAIPYVITKWGLLIIGILPPTAPAITDLMTASILLSYPLARSITCLAHSNRLRADRKILDSITSGSVEVQITRRDQEE